jgi:hypothetical protein
MSFYQILILPLLRASQGSAFTGLCYVSLTIWTSVGGNNYVQQNICDQGSNSRPPASDTILEEHPLPVQLYNSDNIERMRGLLSGFITNDECKVGGNGYWMVI